MTSSMASNNEASQFGGTEDTFLEAEQGQGTKHKSKLKARGMIMRFADFAGTSVAETLLHSDCDPDGSTTGASTDGINNNDVPSSTWAAMETRHIQKLKFMVGLVVIFALACSIGVYFYVSNEEMASFETQFRENAAKVLSSLGREIDFGFGAINALSVSMVSYAEDTNKTWPFVTFPHFGVRTGKFLSLSKCFMIGMFMVVKPEERQAWEAYTAEHGREWVEESIEVQEGDPFYTGPIPQNVTYWDVIFDETHYATGPGDHGTLSKGPHLPVWQGTPQVSSYAPYNWDLIATDKNQTDVNSVLATHKISIGLPYLISEDPEIDPVAPFAAGWVENYVAPDEEVFEPVSDLYFPVILETAHSFNPWVDTRLDAYDPKNYSLVAILGTAMYWRELIRNILPPGSNGVVLVISNECSKSFTYQINGLDSVYLGPGDASDPKYERLAVEAELSKLAEFSLRDSGYSGPPINHDVCPFRVKLTPSEMMEQDFTTNNPIIFSATAGCIFILFAAMFLIYDRWVERRNQIVMDRAERSGAIVDSLFPLSISRRLMEEQHPPMASLGDGAGDRRSASFVSAKGRVKSFLKDGNDETLRERKPLAEVFADTTVYFADIQGFTAWSSSRNPSQVFVLLETIFKEFDDIAKKRRVFKVETVGDSYVAVTGLPDPQVKHAQVMARFAWDSLGKFTMICRKLESSLGPDTGDLAIRIGLHSGPVTAGVLRGDKARFQLFGDTVNTAARMESTGSKNRIQVSNATANLLIVGGKRHWLTRREDSVNAKGKGVVATYWLAVSSNDAASVQSATPRAYFDELQLRHDITKDNKLDRLIDWMVTLLLEHIHAVVARQNALGVLRQDPTVHFDRAPGQTCLDEVQDVIKLPKFNSKAAEGADTLADRVEISAVVVEQLGKLVTVLASTYRDNQFHNFEHACAVSMSVDKFLRRIANPDMEIDDEVGVASTLHDYTHGINSDPLTIMAIVFSALIHDCDHRGVSNTQLCQEDQRLANAYRSKSVAEQNSLDLSWEVLMDDDFKELRACIFANEEELLRFRQVVVNVVLATDIFDKELNDLRKARWGRAFAEAAPTADSEYLVDTRATIVIEHIIQASDVAHTMQHWHVYRRWNERLFAEMTAAYRAGRMEKDPASFWYRGELGFFDNYVIPLAKKLKDCRVFGVSSDECLNFAQNNRNEWEQCGQEIVAALVERFDAEYFDLNGTIPEEDSMKVVDV